LFGAAVAATSARRGAHSPGTTAIDTHIRSGRGVTPTSE
jgi:hypothetical protein